jgi:hypothetical protein
VWEVNQIVSTTYGELSQRKMQGNGYNSAAPQAGATAQTAATSSSTNGRPHYNNKIERVQAMEAAAFSGDMELFKSFLTDDVYYRVGNATEVRGPQAIVDYMGQMMASSLAINDMKIIGAWELGDTVIVEFNIGGFRYDINQQIRYPCIDIYRFRGDKIRDWRVFAIDPTFVVK